MQRGRGWLKVFTSRRECTGQCARGTTKLLSVVDSLGPNCRRLCGGDGACAENCEFKNGPEGTKKQPIRPLHHNCSLTIVETATLEQVSNGAVTAKITGSHVPVGAMWHPPHPQQLVVDKEALEGALLEASRSGNAGRVSGFAAAAQRLPKPVVHREPRKRSRKDPAELGNRDVRERVESASTVLWHSSYVTLGIADSVTGSSLQPAVVGALDKTTSGASFLAHPALVPSGKQIAKAARARVVSETSIDVTGFGPTSDWDQLELFAREVMLPKGDLIYLRPARCGLAPIVVASNEAALKLCRTNNGRWACADAKVDTNAAKSPLSAILTRTPEGTVYPLCFWYSVAENFDITTTAVDKFLGMVPCGHAGCSCPISTTSSADGSITVSRACARDAAGKVKIRLCMGVDKHWPSINAYRSLGFPVTICDFHGVKAFDKQMYERTGLSKEACFQLGIALIAKASETGSRRKLCPRHMVDRNNCGDNRLGCAG